MERRGFLGLLGAAVAAPLVPAQAGSRALFDYAVSHAKTFPVISVGGLSKRGGMTIAQAEEMMRELASRGMVRMVTPSRGGAPRAASKILVGDHWGIGRTRQPRHVGPAKSTHETQARTANQG